MPSCFVVTAVCGENSPEVQVLQKWRDTTLQNSVFGRAFVRTYWVVGPILAGLLERFTWLKKPTRLLLKLFCRMIL